MWPWCAPVRVALYAHDICVSTARMPSASLECCYASENRQVAINQQALNLLGHIALYQASLNSSSGDCRRWSVDTSRAIEISRSRLGPSFKVDAANTNPCACLEKYRLNACWSCHVCRSVLAPVINLLKFCPCCRYSVVGASDSRRTLPHATAITYIHVSCIAA